MPPVTRAALGSAALFLCDIQTRFRPLIYRAETVIKRSNLLLQAAPALEMPVFCSEQYVKAFGNTVPGKYLEFHMYISSSSWFSRLKSYVLVHLELQEQLSKDTTTHPYVYEKKLFSMMTDDAKTGSYSFICLYLSR